MITGTLKHIISLWFRPALDALWFGRHLPWTLRWRLIAFQPLSLLTNAMICLPYLFRRPFSVEFIPISDNRHVRALVFRPESTSQPTPVDDSSASQRLRPLHVDCHAGGFIGGYPESNVLFCQTLAEKTGAVVISLSYRLAPVHPFPAAIDDVDAAIAWLQTNAESRYGADSEILTVSGFSAGGNLALAATQATACHEPAKTAIKAAVTFYAPVDLRLAPWQKPKPPGDIKDPLGFLMPLFDSYAGPMKATHSNNPRMNPTLAELQTLPRRMMLVIPKVDILVKEQLDFVERVQNECEEQGDTTRKVESLWLEDAFHGYFELPNSVVPKEKKMETFDTVTHFIRQTHREHGWWTS